MPTYSSIKEYEARFAEMNIDGTGCTDEVADILLMERKKLCNELHEFFPEYFATSEGCIRYAII